MRSIEIAQHPQPLCDRPRSLTFLCLSRDVCGSVMLFYKNNTFTIIRSYLGTLRDYEHDGNFVSAIAVP